MELNILNLLLVVLAGWAGGSLASRLGYPAVLGELIAGLVLGPGILGLLSGGASYDGIEVLARMGVLLLMLYVGMEIDPRELGKASWGGFLAAIGGFITPFALSYVAVRAAGGTGVASVMVGIAVGVTSLASKSRMLADLHVLDTRIAHVMLAGALVADTLSLVVFAGLSSLGGSALDPMALLAVLGRAMAFFAACGVVGIWVLPRVFKLFTRFGLKQRGLYFTLIVLVALAFGEAAELAGLHAILGTFVAGLFLREGMLDPKLNRELNTLVRDVSVGFLAPMFYVLAGFQVSLDVFQTDLGLLLLLTAIAFAAKILGTMLFYLPTGHGWKEGLVIGGGMNARGSVEIVVAGIGLQMGLIDQKLFSILVFIAILTTASAPAFLKWGIAWLSRQNLLVRTDKRTQLLIVGAGPTARALAQVLAESQPVALIDSNPSRVAEAKAEGLNAVAGSALDVSSLSEAGAAKASCAIAMTGNAEINMLAARQLRDVFQVPALHVLVKGTDRQADDATLGHLDATMLFGKSLPLEEWDYQFGRGAVVISKVPGQAGSAEDLLGAPAHSGDPELLLAIEKPGHNAKSLVPFHAGITCGPDDLLVLATARGAARPTSDHFDELVRRCVILDLEPGQTPEGFFRQAAEKLAEVVSESAESLLAGLLEREHQGSTVLTPGLALPHILLSGTDRFALLVARSRTGVELEAGAAPVHAMFVLAGTLDQRNLHLKSISAIAQIWQSRDFEVRWHAAQRIQDLRELMLAAPRPRAAQANP